MLQEIKALLSRENVDEVKLAAQQSGREARYYAQRFDSQLAELTETVRAQQIQSTTRNLIMSLPIGAEPQSSDAVFPDPGSYWEVISVAYELAKTSEELPRLTINGEILFDIIGQFDVNLISSTTMGGITRPNKFITDRDKLYLVASKVVDEDVKVAIQVQQFTLEPVFDADNQ